MAVYRLGCVLAAIQLTAVPGYAAEGTAHPEECRAAPAADRSSAVFTRLAPSFFEGAPPLSEAAVPPSRKGKVHREPPHFRDGPALDSPLSEGQGRAWHYREQGWGRRLSPAQVPAASLFPALEEGNESPHSLFRGMVQAFASPSTLRQDRAGDDREEEVRSRFSAPLYLSAALTVSAAAVARLSKDRADDAYETYLKSAGRQRQQSHFEEAERYDRIAGAAFAVMEAGLVWSVYLLFF